MKGDWNPGLGDFLGEWTDELGPECFIQEFVSGGPKNYAYKMQKPSGEIKTVCKVRGITLNHKNAQTVNFETLKNMVHSEGPEVVTVTDPSKISRRKDHVIFSREEVKKYRVVYTKRRRIGAYDTEPYGYQ